MYVRMYAFAAYPKILRLQIQVVYLDRYICHHWTICGLMFISASQGLEIMFFFIFSFFFSFWSSFFWLENYHFLFIPVKFFHYFFIPVFPPFGIFIFLSFASKMVLGPWELPPEAFSRTLFVCFFDCFCALAIFLSYAFKIDLGNCQKELFLEPFSFFFSCWQFFLSVPLKLTWGIAKRNFFSNPFRFFFVLVIVSFLCL